MVRQTSNLSDYGWMTDEQSRSHAMQQLRAARELYSDTGNSSYLAVIDAHLRTIAEVDERRKQAQVRRHALLASRQPEPDVLEETDDRFGRGREGSAVIRFPSRS
jgi:hypothetical protein